MNSTKILLLTIACIACSFPQASATDTPVPPGLDGLKTALENAQPGDILYLEAGLYEVTGFYYGLVIDKQITIRGAEYGKDARERSFTGFNNTSYTGDADPNETTITCATCNMVIRIISSGVVLDGVTVTNFNYTGTGAVSGIYIYARQSSSLSNITIKNCLIRHLGGSFNTEDITGINVMGYLNQTEISQNEVRNLRSTAYVRGILLAGSSSETNNSIRSNAVIDLESMLDPCRADYIFIHNQADLTMDNNCQWILNNANQNRLWDTGFNTFVINQNNTDNCTREMFWFVAEVYYDSSNSIPEKKQLTWANTALTMEKAELKEDNTVLTAEKEQLKEDKDELTAEKQELQEDKDELTAEKQELQEAYTGLNGTVTSLTATKTELTQANTQLITINAVLVKQTVDLTAEKTQQSSIIGVAAIIIITIQMIIIIYQRYKFKPKPSPSEPSIIEDNKGDDIDEDTSDLEDEDSS